MVAIIAASKITIATTPSTNNVIKTAAALSTESSSCGAGAPDAGGLDAGVGVGLGLNPATYK